jgi:hypothetical protein
MRFTRKISSDFHMGSGRSGGAHDALDALSFGITRTKVNYILDPDVGLLRDRLQLVLRGQPEA